MKTRLPGILTSAYLILVGLSIIPIFTEPDALSGIFAVLLTSPWTQILGRFLPGESGLVSGMLLIVMGAVLNAAILFFIVKWIVGRTSRT